jgi:hypothetical protein
MDIEDVRESLAITLQMVVDFQKEVAMPRQEYGSIQEALKDLRLLLPGQSPSISPPDFCWQDHSDHITCGEWGVWDGRKSFTDGTLAGAVNKCRDAHQPKAPAEDPEAVEAMISESLQPLP